MTINKDTLLRRQTEFKYCACNCGKQIPRFRSDGQQQFYASGHCLNKKGTNSPRYGKKRHLAHNWKGKPDVDPKTGYARILRPHHRDADSRGRVLLHRYLKELDLGYYIPKGYEVHHINGIKNDNRPENLALLPIAEHRRLHAIQRGLGQI